jgi:hypothetical protein
VENTPNYSPVCQNTAILHLTGWLVKPFKPICFCLLHYAIGHPQTLPEYHYEALFLRRRSGIRSVFPTPKMTLIREKTTLLFSEYSILSPIWLSNAESQLKMTANSTYWEAKLREAGWVARSAGKELLFSRSIIPVRDPKSPALHPPHPSNEGCPSPIPVTIFRRGVRYQDPRFPVQRGYPPLF